MATPQDDKSVVSLRLKSVSMSHLDEESLSFSDALDIIDCLHSTDERKYVCRDYLTRRSTRKGHCQTSLSSSSSDEDEDNDIDVTCRFKMCEWAYRVCDHFHVNREIVGVGFSILDRFVDRCCCDRTAFKLASMTCLYLAAKLVNAKQISICNLVELSRGEFEGTHIADMESIILKTLDWALNPPTVQAFVYRFMSLLPYDDPVMTMAVYQRANFFAELSVYDYLFVTDRRHFVALACTLNAMEQLDTSDQSSSLRLEFLENAQSSLLSSLESLDMNELGCAQERLWNWYLSSPQVEQDGAAIRPSCVVARDGCDKDLGVETHSMLEQATRFNYSPVSVVVEATPSEM